MEQFFIAIGITIALIFIYAIVIRFDIVEHPQRRAGRRGEEQAKLIIGRVLNEKDNLITGVEFTYEGRPCELDCVIINNYGVFIVEVKNYVGQLVGGADDFEWTKYKTTDAGNTYVKTVKNPIKQVKRQIYLLAKYLNSYGVNVWVKGYVIMLNGNSPVRSEYIFTNYNDIDRAIHTRDRVMLSDATVERIKEVIYHNVTRN